MIQVNLINENETEVEIKEDNFYLANLKGTYDTRLVYLFECRECKKMMVIIFHNNSECLGIVSLGQFNQTYFIRELIEEIEVIVK